MKVKLVFGLMVLGLVAMAILVQRSGDVSSLVLGDGAMAEAIQSSSAPTLSRAQILANVPRLPSAQASSSVQMALATDSSGAASMNASSSSVAASLSYPRVDPSQQAKHFLTAMDETAVPKINARKPTRDDLFDYAKATPAELKAKALSGDPFAAWDYANYVRFHQMRVKDPRGYLVKNPNSQVYFSARQEMREFMVRAMNGGLYGAASVLSMEYNGPQEYLVESLAWRKIAFAMGESERFDCLRDSTTCIVKDFNNLDRDEFFYPCVKAAWDQCSQANYEDATLLALQYVSSLDFAIENTHRESSR